MPPGDQGSITRWLDDLKAGEGEAARRLWERYLDRLVHLARSELQHSGARPPRTRRMRPSAPSTASAGARRGAGSRC